SARWRLLQIFLIHLTKPAGLGRSNGLIDRGRVLVVKFLQDVWKPGPKAFVPRNCGQRSQEQQDSEIRIRVGDLPSRAHALQHSCTDGATASRVEDRCNGSGTRQEINETRPFEVIVARDIAWLRRHHFPNTGELDAQSGGEHSYVAWVRHWAR